MRHHNTNRKFGREMNQRNALMASLAASLITHGKIVTSEAKAKSLRPAIEKMVTRARRGTLADLRILSSRLSNNTRLANKLIKEIGPKYKEREGGYVRVTKLGARSGRGDAAALALIEFV